MSPKILTIIGAFLAGIICGFFKINSPKIKFWHEKIYQFCVIFLLFKIGFSGGREIFSAEKIFLSGTIVIFLSIIWTFLVSILISRSKFSRAEKISIAVHFGSVSIGTFIAAVSFLDALQIPLGPSATIWIALMEFPAIFFGMKKLKINFSQIFFVFKKDWKLIILPAAIFFGFFFGEKFFAINYFLENFLTPFLFYFLFEIGRKAAKSLPELRQKINSIFFVGIFLPLIGGLFGAAAGTFLKYEIGNIFILSILLASASYILAPLCMQEFFKIARVENPAKITATATALSVGIVLPFNILCGFEIYFFAIKIFQNYQIFAAAAFLLPFFLAAIIFFRQKFSN